MSKRQRHKPCAGSSSGGCFGLLRVAGYYSAGRCRLALECSAWDCLLALASALASICHVFRHSCFGFLACASMACRFLEVLCACVAVASSLDIDIPSVDLLSSTMGCLGVLSKHCIFFRTNAVLHACPCTACRFLEVLCACVPVANSLDSDWLSMVPPPRTMGCLDALSKHRVLSGANVVVAVQSNV